MQRALRFSALSIYAFAIAALPAMVVPLASIDVGAQKGLLTALALGVALCVLAAQILFVRAAPGAMRSLAAYVGAPLALAAGLSTLLNHTGLSVAWGTAYEWGSVGSFVLFAAAVFSGASLSSRAALFIQRSFISFTLISSAVSAVIFVLKPDLIPAGTLAGGWAVLSFLIAASIATAAGLAIDEEKAHARFVYAVAILALFGAFALFFEQMAAIVLAIVFALCAAVVGYWRAARPLSRVVVYMLAPSVAAGALALSMTGPALHFSPAVRPSFFASESVATPAFLKSRMNVLVGEGPGSFSAAWERYRPIEFNATPYWGARADSAYSALMTLVVMFGMLGFLAFLLWPYGAIGASVRAIRAGAPTLGPPAATVFFSVAASVFYAPTLPLFLVGGLMAGMHMRSQVSADDLWQPQFAARLAVAAAAAAAGVAMIWLALGQAYAASAYAQGIALAPSDAQRGAELLRTAAGAWPSPQYSRDASRATFVYGSHMLTADVSGSGQGEKLVSAGLQLADAAVELDPNDVASLLSRAELYMNRAHMTIEDAKAAKESLDAAVQLAPNRPDARYLLALLAVKLGQNDAAQAYLMKVRELKPDFDPADIRIQP